MVLLPRWTIVLALCLAVASLAAENWVPNQMIIKTSQPRQIERGSLGLAQLDSFLQELSVSSIEPMRPMRDERWFVASFAQPLDWPSLQQQRPALNGVEYIQPNYLNSFFATPNDPYFVNQQMNLVYLPEAWNITTGSNDVMVAVIDSGLFFDHPDLQQHVFINTNEIPDNGIDDDGNGYIDDWRGWDFVDAPELSGIALGDYLVEDNDASDENKHGTHVSGIVCADANNNIGVCGTMWNASLLVLRAGFRSTQGSGYLQDDDCAAAIMYAADMGADVINMSWGDTEYSPVIDDACQYAYDKGTILVASAGNSSTEGVNYPARLGTTIAVGGVNSYLVAAGYSSGPELDVCAPASLVWSTWDPESETPYVQQSGTSMAAPFVTGVVGLLLSNNPDLDAEQVRARLNNTAQDQGDEGFDNTYGWGVVDAYAALSAEEQPIIEITYPSDNSGLSSSFDIIGSAYGEGFLRYCLMYTMEEDPESYDWVDVINHTNTPTFFYEPVDDSVLASFDFEPYQEDGDYLMRLQLTTVDYDVLEVNRSFYIDQSAPVMIDSLTQAYKRFSGELPQFYAEVHYDEDVNVHVEILGSDGLTYNAYSDFTEAHLMIPLPAELPDGPIDVRFIAQNRSGMTSQSDWYDDIVTVDHNSVDVNSYLQRVDDAPLLGLPPYDSRAFVAMTLVDTSSYGPVSFYREQGSQLVSQFDMEDEFKPLATGNTDTEGIEVLGLNLNTVSLYETIPGGSYPTVPIYVETSVMGGTLADYDDDGVDEMILVRNLATSRAITLYTRDAYDINEYVSIYNQTPTNGRNDFVTTVLVDDFDRNGVTDLIAGDNDGDVIVYELRNGGAAPIQTWWLRLPIDEAFYLAKGDFDGDRNIEFCVGGETTDTSDPSKTYWFFGFFRPSGYHNYVMYDWLMFDQVEGQNCIVAANVDDDEADELVCSLAPNLYIVDQVDGKMTPVWKGGSDRSFQTVVLPNDGTNDMLAIVNNTTNEVTSRTFVSPDVPFTGPATPQAFSAQPVNETTVRLTWQTTDADEYNVYRRLPGDDIFQIGVTTDGAFDAIDLTTGVSYEFAVTAIDYDYTPVESQTTLWKTATPDYAPTLLSIETISANRLQIVFDRALSTNAQNTGHYVVDFDMGRPKSVLMSDQDTKLTLTFAQVFAQISEPYTLDIQDIESASGTPFPDMSAQFTYGGDKIPPEVIDVTPRRSGTIELVFSEMLSASADDVNSYTLTPPPIDRNNSIVAVSVINEVVTIELAKKIQVSNQPYYLSFNGIEDLAGNPMRNDDDRLRFSLADIINLDHMKIAPNPLYANEDEEIRFFDLPLNKSGKLRIYNFSGDLIYDESIGPLNETDYFASWDARNSISQPVSSGTYFYIIEMGGERKKGVISVIR